MVLHQSKNRAKTAEDRGKTSQDRAKTTNKDGLETQKEKVVAVLPSGEGHQVGADLAKGL